MARMTVDYCYFCFIISESYNNNLKFKKKKYKINIVRIKKNIIGMYQVPITSNFCNPLLKNI